jgi:cell wall assembly regulator SMI1
MSLAASVEAIRAHHHPRSPRSDVELRLAKLEERAGLVLPADVKRFYRAMDGALLFSRADAPYDLLPIAKVKRASIAVAGVDDDELCPSSWYAICAVRDGNYIAIDLAASGHRGRMLDVFHETPDDAATVAPSFTAFLAKALASHGEHDWLSPARSTRKRRVATAPSHGLDPIGRKLAVTKVELSATLARSRTGPVRLRWIIELAFKPIRLGRESVEADIVVELDDLGVRDFRKLSGVSIDVAARSRPYVVLYGERTLKLPCSALRVDIGARAGARFAIQFAVSVRLPGGGVRVLTGSKRGTYLGLQLPNRLIPKPKDAQAALVLAGQFTDTAPYGPPDIELDYPCSFLPAKGA